MQIIIQVAEKDSARAWGLLVRHSPGAALPNRTFIISQEAARALRDAGIKFTEISRNGVLPSFEGAVTGERI